MKHSDHQASLDRILAAVVAEMDGRAFTPPQVAAAFCALTDDDQAQVFIEIARIASTWERSSGMQWWAVGRHLRDCECSTYEARDLIDEIAGGMKP